MSKILLARHGNTFGPGDRIVWVGAQEDLPLVEKGEEQARALGNALRGAGRNREAANALVRAARLTPDDPEIITALRDLARTLQP